MIAPPDESSHFWPLVTTKRLFEPGETVARRERAVQKATRFPTQRPVASIFCPAHDVAGGRGKRNTCATSPGLNGFGSRRMGRMCFWQVVAHFMRKNFCGCSAQSALSSTLILVEPKAGLGHSPKHHDFFSHFFRRHPAIPLFTTRFGTKLGLLKIIDVSNAIFWDLGSF